MLSMATTNGRPIGDRCRRGERSGGGGGGGHFNPIVKAFKYNADYRVYSQYLVVKYFSFYNY